MSAAPASSGDGHPAGRVAPPSRSATPRYLGALRHEAPMLAVLALVAAGAVYGISESAPTTYEASAVIAAAPDPGGGVVDAQAQRRGLATGRELAGTHPVLTAAATQIPGATADSLSAKVRSAIVPGANVITISARDERRAVAAKIANVVANSLLAVRSGVLRAHLRSVGTDLRRQISRLQAGGGQQQAVAALRRRLGELAVSEATAGRELVLAASAGLPAERTPSNGARNAVIALAVSLLLGLAALLARERLKPRVRDADQLRALSRLDLLAEIPHNPRRRGLPGRNATIGEHEQYQTLRGCLEATDATNDPLIVLVTSGAAGEGRTTVTASLGRALHGAGHDVLLVAADARQPTLHTALDVDDAAGFGECLSALAVSTEPPPIELVTGAVVRIGQPDDDGPANLSIIPPGHVSSAPGALFTVSVTRRLFAHLRRLEFDFIIIDAPPLAGFVDAQVLAPEADVVLVVARLHHARLESAARMQDILDRLSITPIGLVVLGMKAESGGSWTTEAAAATGEPPPQPATGGPSRRRSRPG